MSENSFVNSTFSDNTSYNDVLNNPESFSLGSPVSQRSSDDLQSSYSNLYSSPKNDLSSLPIMSTNVSTSVLQFKKLIGDNELSELLTRKQPKFTPQAPKCAKCDKRVYQAEETRAANKIFHKLCFKCYQCNKLLEPNTLTEHQGDLYCKNCYGKKFGPKGYGYGGGAGVLSSESSSPLPTVNTNIKTPLRSTFSSIPNNHNETPYSRLSLNHQTSNNNLAETPNGHANDFAKTITITTTTATPLTPPTTTIATTKLNSGFQSLSLLSNKNGTHINSAVNQEKKTNTMQFGGSEKCARCQKAVYAAEKVVAASKFYHKLCYTCSTCKKMLSSMNCCDNSDGDIFCKSCYGKQYGPKGVGYGIGAGTLQTN